MHDTAYLLGKMFLDLYWKDEFKKVLDVGAMDVNGTLRDFCPAGAEWCGVDMAEGKGVDIVLQDPHSFPFEDESFDVIVSSSAMEHDGMFWVTFVEMARVLRPGGLLYINAPSNGWYHAYPHDCWRFYPDSGLALEKWAKRMNQDMRLVDSFICPRQRDVWNDCVLIFSKGAGKEEGPFLSDHIAGAANIRRPGVEDVINKTLYTEDMLIHAQLRKNAEATKACLDKAAEALEMARNTL